jgi:hypothetical protein
MPAEIFIAYSRADESMKDALLSHLSPLRRSGLIAEWHDRLIKPGTDWQNEIDSNLNSCEIFIPLISSDFIASDYCYGIEMHRGMERAARGEAQVIPVILRPCLWSSLPFGSLQVLPKDGKPVVSWPSADEAYADVAKALHALLTLGATKPLSTGGSNGAAVHAGGGSQRQPDWILYDRRRKIFDDIQEFHNFVLRSNGAFEITGPGEYRDFRRNMDLAENLYGTSDVRTVLEQFDENVREFWVSSQTICKSIETGEVEAINKNHELLSRLIEFGDKIPAVFRPHLSMSSDEEKLREKFVAIVRSMKGNCYSPSFGSPEYWEAESMADKGWFRRMPPFGYMVGGSVTPEGFQ